MTDKTIIYDKPLSRRVVEKSDGSIEATSHGNVVTANPDGTVSMSMPIITRIDLYNIIDLVSYDLSHDQEKIQHVFEFKDGGKGTVAYTSEGKMLKFAIENGATINVTKDGVVSIGMKRPLEENSP